MNDFPFAAIGFDLDGTLVDSALDLCPAVNHALSLEGRPSVELAALRDMIGGGTRMMLERALEHSGGPVPAPRFEILADELLRYYEAHIADHTVPYEGCLAALDALTARGCKLAVCTNKIERYARLLLDALGMTDRFACIIGGDTLGPGRAKPAPDMINEAILQCGGGGRFAFVGDSSFDTRAAQAASVPVVALSFGYNDIPAADMAADAVIGHYRELVPALEALALTQPPA